MRSVTHAILRSAMNTYQLLVELRGPGLHLCLVGKNSGLDAGDHIRVCGGNVHALPGVPPRSNKSGGSCGSGANDENPSCVEKCSLNRPRRHAASSSPR